MVKVSEKALARKIKSLENSLKISDEYAKKLEARMRILEAQKKMLMDEERKKNESQRKKIIGGREIAMRDSLIKSMAAESDRLRKRFSKIFELEMIARDGCIPVIQIEDFEREKILEKDRNFGINGSVVFFGSVSDSRASAKTLVALQPKAVIAELDGNIARMLENADIFVISPKSVSMSRYLEFLGMDRAEFEREIKKRFING